MNGQTHRAIGFLTGAVYSYYSHSPIFDTLMLSITSLSVATAPDWDTVDEWSTFLFNPTGTIIYSVLQKRVKHRGFTHSLLGLMLWNILFLVWGIILFSIFPTSFMKHTLQVMLMGNILGYISHIIADMFTVKGVALFYPVEDRIKFPLTLSYNSRVETVIFLISLGIGVLFVIRATLNAKGIFL